MSETTIRLIPEDPYLVPSQDRQDAAWDYLHAILPEADFWLRIEEGVTFFDCGLNLMTIACPDCGTVLSEEWWQERMDRDFEGFGFRLDREELGCCGAAHTVAELVYDWPCGFARFGIDAMNPNVEALSPKQVATLAECLGTPVRVVIRHL